ncbi:hypothetical protein PG994_008610 [Apiospora phragmitis]|uniref:Uncharacterized protein n=1 Tax=Apiospora phragmitis TaxID=2905665 RepID=A0ABR1UHI2_9PEZI
MAANSNSNSTAKYEYTNGRVIESSAYTPAPVSEEVLATISGAPPGAPSIFTMLQAPELPVHADKIMAASPPYLVALPGGKLIHPPPGLPMPNNMAASSHHHAAPGQPKIFVTRPSTQVDLAWMTTRERSIVEHLPHISTYDLNLVKVAYTWFHYLQELHEHLKSSSYSDEQLDHLFYIIAWLSTVDRLHEIVKHGDQTDFSTREFFPEPMQGEDGLSPLEQARRAIVQLSEAQFGDYLAQLADWDFRPDLKDPRFFFGQDLIEWATILPDEDEFGPGTYGSLDITFLDAVDYLNYLDVLIPDQGQVIEEQYEQMFLDFKSQPDNNKAKPYWAYDRWNPDEYDSGFFERSSTEEESKGSTSAGLSKSSTGPSAHSTACTFYTEIYHDDTDASTSTLDSDESDLIGFNTWEDFGIESSEDEEGVEYWGDDTDSDSSSAWDSEVEDDKAYFGDDEGSDDDDDDHGDDAQRPRSFHGHHHSIFEIMHGVPDAVDTILGEIYTMLDGVHIMDGWVYSVLDELDALCYTRELESELEPEDVEFSDSVDDEKSDDDKPPLSPEDQLRNVVEIMKDMLSDLDTMIDSASPESEETPSPELQDIDIAFAETWYRQAPDHNAGNDENQYNINEPDWLQDQDVRRWDLHVLLPDFFVDITAYLNHVDQTISDNCYNSSSTSIGDGSNYLDDDEDEDYPEWLDDQEFVERWNIGSHNTAYLDLVDQAIADNYTSSGDGDEGEEDDDEDEDEEDPEWNNDDPNHTPSEDGDQGDDNDDGNDDPSDDDDGGSEAEEEQQLDGPWLPIRQPWPAQHSLYGFQSRHEAVLPPASPILMGQRFQPPIQRPAAAPAPAPAPQQLVLLSGQTSDGAPAAAAAIPHPAARNTTASAPQRPVLHRGQPFSPSPVNQSSQAPPGPAPAPAAIPSQQPPSPQYNPQFVLGGSANIHNAEEDVRSFLQRTWRQPHRRLFNAMIAGLEEKYPTQNSGKCLGLSNLPGWQ